MKQRISMVVRCTECDYVVFRLDSPYPPINCSKCGGLVEIVQEEIK